MPNALAADLLGFGARARTSRCRNRARHHSHDVHLAGLGVDLDLGEVAEKGAPVFAMRHLVTVTTTGTMSPNQSMSAHRLASLGIGLEERPAVAMSTSPGSPRAHGGGQLTSSPSAAAPPVGISSGCR